MIHIPEKKLNLLLPWKCASQTLQLRLAKLAQQPYPKLFYFNPYLNKVTHQHVDLSNFLALPESNLNYELAVFVRNPYDRVYSGFQQMLRDVNVIPKLNFPEKWIKELVMSDLMVNLNTLFKSECNINQWLKLLHPYEILDAGRNTCFCLHPVTYWSHNNSQLIPQFIGQVEFFEEDYARLCLRYNITNNIQSNANVANPNYEDLDENGYQYSTQLDAYSIAKINDLFHGDFVNFGYKKIAV